eukprot:SAG11_NODE_4719_length_1793_cov_2.991736_1_plen_397_part_00
MPATQQVRGEPGGYATPPARDSPEFYRVPGGGGVQELDSAGAKRDSTLARYKSEVSHWQQFCKESNYDPNVFDWDTFELFSGWMLERFSRQTLTSHVTALNHHFCQFGRYRNRSPLRAEHGPLTQIETRYKFAYLKRQADPARTTQAKARHSALDSWFSPTAVQLLIDIALQGAPADGRDATEILVGTLYGCRAESSAGWICRFSVIGHLEIAFGQWKTLAEAAAAFLAARSIPPSLDPAHPRSRVFAGVRRALDRYPNFLAVTNGPTAAARITKNVRRLLPPGMLLLPGNRMLGAKSMRKTMASAAAAQQIPFEVIRQWGLWSRKSTVLEDGYVDRSYHVDPFMASLVDWLMPVARAPFRLFSNRVVRRLQFRLPPISDLGGNTVLLCSTVCRLV